MSHERSRLHEARGRHDFNEFQDKQETYKAEVKEFLKKKLGFDSALPRIKSHADPYFRGPGLAVPDLHLVAQIKGEVRGVVSHDISRAEIYEITQSRDLGVSTRPKTPTYPEERKGNEQKSLTQKENRNKK